MMTKEELDNAIKELEKLTGNRVWIETGISDVYTPLKSKVVKNPYFWKIQCQFNNKEFIFNNLTIQGALQDALDYFREMTSPVILEENKLSESGIILTNEGIAQLPESEQRRMYDALLRSLFPPSEKTYWIITIGLPNGGMTHYQECDGPFIRVSDIKATYGEAACILFAMQLTREQYEHFRQ